MELLRIFSPLQRMHDDEIIAIDTGSEEYSDHCLCKCCHYTVNVHSFKEGQIGFSAHNC